MHLSKMRISRSLLAAVVASSYALGGCGSSRQMPLVGTTISFQSPALIAGRVIPASYKCGSKIWLPLRWGALPINTGELALYVGGLGAREVIGKGETRYPLVAATLVIGLSPSLRGLPVDRLPPGARLLTDSGIAECSPRLAGRKLVFRLFALSTADRIKLSTLKAESPRELLVRIGRDALATGRFTASYGAG
jgi:hypothetical protein